MKKKLSGLLCLLLIALLILPLDAKADDPWDNARWRVNVTHDLNGGQWPQGRALAPRTLEGELNKSMPPYALEPERGVIPLRAGYEFLGWSVRFTHYKDGSVIYDSGDVLWDLNKPFDYYPNNPLTMNCLMTARWRAAAKPVADEWTVHVSHNLMGGSWPDGCVISPYTLTAKVGQPMPKDSLDAEKLVKPYLSESNFLGWSVLFTNPNTGEIVYDGQAYIWDLNLPFQFYPDNPRVMNCLMIANWGAMQQGGGYAPLPQPGGDLAQEILPDSRLFTWPYPAGMDPLPETPPPCDNLIAGTTWLRGAIITGIGDGDVVPVYAFPVYNGPVMRWIGLYEKLDYGLYLDKDWTMLYNPLWVENSGIGFVDANVTAFPGSEE